MAFLRRYWSLRTNFFWEMKLKNKIENVFHIKGQSTWTTVCPLRYYLQKKANFLYYRYPRKLQNLDPISIFFYLYNFEIKEKFFHYRLSHKILLGSTVFFVFLFIFSKVTAKKLQFCLRFWPKTAKNWYNWFSIK